MDRKNWYYLRLNIGDSREKKCILPIFLSGTDVSLIFQHFSATPANQHFQHHFHCAPARRAGGGEGHGRLAARAGRAEGAVRGGDPEEKGSECPDAARTRLFGRETDSHTHRRQRHGIREYADGKREGEGGHCEIL